jgi:sigma-B regulation protein RsbU (phosphoserine phosphatase)
MFATVFVGILNTRTGSLTYVNAGHDHPVLIRANGSQMELKETGPVVGVFPHCTHDLNRVELEPGDTLFAYTDGLTEARSPGGKLFGKERLLALLEGTTRPAETLLADLIAHLREHVADAEPSDDVTMLAVRRFP